MLFYAILQILYMILKGDISLLEGRNNLEGNGGIGKKLGKHYEN